MFMVNWFWNALSYLGLSNRSGRVVFLGLDNAGKTTLLHVLRDGKVMVHEPTRHPQFEELVVGNMCFKAHDLGGHKAARRLWRQYLANVDGVVFLVDSTDHKRLSECGEELQALFSEKCLENVPFVILGNKIDVKGACSELQLRQALNVEHLLTGKEGKDTAPGVRPVEIFMCSIVKRGGYQDGFRWLANYLKQS